MLFFKQSHYSSKYWQIIESPIELQNGDLIIFTSDNIKENHCMLVDSIMDIEQNNVRIKVVDCSQFPHANDTRKNGCIGIGRGDISIFYSKENGWNSYRHNLRTYTGMLNFTRVR